MGAEPGPRGEIHRFGIGRRRALPRQCAGQNADQDSIAGNDLLADHPAALIDRLRRPVDTHEQFFG